MKTYLKNHLIDIIIITSLLALSLIALLVVNLTKKNDNLLATIYIDGEIVETIDLSKESGERDIVINDYLIVTVKHNAIKVLDNDCPSKYCISQGYTSSSNKPLICAYHKVYIKLSKNTTDVDVVAG